MKGRLVLVVDGSADDRRVLERILAAAGYRVAACASAEEAWQALAVRAPEVVLVDWNLPGASGVDFARRLRVAPRFQRLLVIMLASRGALEDQLKGFQEGGVNAFVTKPFSPDELLARLDALFRRKDALS